MCFLRKSFMCVSSLRLIGAGVGEESSNVHFPQQQTKNGMIILPMFGRQFLNQRYLTYIDGSTILRNRRLSNHDVNNFEATTEIFQDYGAHYVDLWIGTPPQRQTLLVDTGSSSIAFPCTGCEDCGQGNHIDKVFSPEESSTFKYLTCNECLRGTCTSKSDNECKLYLEYAEGSTWDGIEASDVISVGGFFDISNRMDNSPSRFSIRHNSELEIYNTTDARQEQAFIKFGCQLSMSGLLKLQLADGILGMNHTDQSFWNQMFIQKKVSAPRFSLCYVKRPFAHFDGTSAGSLVLGGTDKRLHEAPMVYTPFIKSSPFYQVKIRKMYIHRGGGSSLTGPNADIYVSKTRTKQIMVSEEMLNRGNPIVDSGTTGVYLHEDIKKAFNEAWVEIMGFEFPTTPIKIKGDDLKRWPTIIFQFSGYTDENDDGKEDDNDSFYFQNKAGSLDPQNPNDILIAFPTSHYMEFSLANKNFYSRFEFANGETDQGGVILGAALMQGHDILFDIKNSRIGIAESKCDYNYLVSGIKSDEFDPFNVIFDVMKHYYRNFCRSDKCQGHVIPSFWLSIFILLIMYYGIHKRRCLLQYQTVTLGFKSKDSGEDPMFHLSLSGDDSVT